MAMHVLQLGPYPPPEGGVSRNMLAIRDELFRAGQKCSIIATTKGVSNTGEIDVHRPSSTFALLKLLVTTRYDILHLHVGGEVTPRVLSLAFACSVFGRGRSVLTLHSGGYPETKEAVLAKPKTIRGMIFRRFSQIIAVNEKIADVFRLYGVADQRISVILPFSLQRPDGNVNVPPPIAEFYKTHSPILLAVGGLEKEYDPLFQIAAMKDILEHFPHAGLVIAGSGSMLDEIEQTVAKSGYAENIYIAGNIEHRVILHLVNDADVLLRTTLFDGDAISVREAIFLGTPVIATDNGMRPAGVHLMPVGDADSLVSEVISAINSPLTKSTVTCDDTKNIDEVLKVYKELIGD